MDKQTFFSEFQMCKKGLICLKKKPEWSYVRRSDESKFARVVRFRAMKNQYTLATMVEYKFLTCQSHSTYSSLLPLRLKKKKTQHGKTD